MNKKISKVIATSLAVVTMFSLVGCGQVNAAKRLVNMAKSMEDIQTMEGVLTMNMDMNVAGVPATAKANIDVEANTSQAASHESGTMTVDAAGVYSNDIQMEAYQEVANGTGTTYIWNSTDNTWWQEQVDKSDVSGIGAADWTSIATAAALLSVAEEKAQVNGMTCTKLSGKIKGDVIVNMLDASGVSTSSIDQFFDTNNLKGTKVACSIYIYDETNHLAELTVDLTDVANGAVSSALGIDQATLKSCTMDFVVNTYNGDVNVVIPDEAYNAQSMS